MTLSKTRVHDYSDRLDHKGSIDKLVILCEKPHRIVHVSIIFLDKVFKRKRTCMKISNATVISDQYLKEGTV